MGHLKNLRLDAEAMLVELGLSDSERESAVDLSRQIHEYATNVSLANAINHDRKPDRAVLVMQAALAFTLKVNMGISERVLAREGK